MNTENRISRGENILVADDDLEMGYLLKDILSKEDYEVEVVSSGHAAKIRILEEDFSVIITDIKMPDVDGMEVLDFARRTRPETAVILITAFGTIDLAVEAMRKGAFHFVTKPFKMREITAIVRKGIEHNQLKRENILLRKEVHERYRFGNIIGKSPAMRRVYDLISRVAPTNSNVLIIGESGTGKELVAKALHYNSPRGEKPFLPINCAAIPEGLLESELFGHVRGAFTGAVAAHRGMFLEANGGTILLDEIAEMGMGLQAKILRVLEDKEVRPVGGAEGRQVDVRIIAATQRNLREEIAKGKFREDLYYRLNVIPIQLPPLKDRSEDIPLLAEYFLKKYAEEVKSPAKSFSKEAMAQLMTHTWRGNVRELENLIERALVLATGEVIGVDDLPFEPAMHSSLSLVEKAIENNMSLKQLEEIYIDEILKKTGGKKETAAKILGINRRTLYRKENKTGQKSQAD